MKRDVLNKISRVINYEESERVRLNVYVDQLGDQQEEYLLIGEELILRLDNKIRKVSVTRCPAAATSIRPCASPAQATRSSRSVRRCPASCPSANW